MQRSIISLPIAFFLFHTSVSNAEESSEIEKKPPESSIHIIVGTDTTDVHSPLTQPNNSSPPVAPEPETAAEGQSQPVDESSEAVHLPATAGESATPSSTTERTEASPQKKKKKKKKTKINARIHGAWEMSHEDIPDDPSTTADEFEKRNVENKFLVRRARFKLSWRPEHWMTAVLQVGDFNEHDFGVSLLRNAYIHLAPLKYLEVRVGQFKKPFSRLELRSSGKLRVFRRGLGNSLLIEELRYGDRDLGIQLSGRIIPAVKLDYEVGIFNGSGPDISEKGNSKDVAARLKFKPHRTLDFGINGSFKFFNGEENVDKFAWAAGADGVFKLAGFRTHLETIVGVDHLFRTRETQVTDDAPPTLDLLAIISYKHTLSASNTTVALEPVFKIELLDPNTKVLDDQVLVYSPGFNIYIGKFLRLMIQGELIRSSTNSATRFPRNELLALQLCFDI